MWIAWGLPRATGEDCGLTKGRRFRAQRHGFLPSSLNAMNKVRRYPPSWPGEWGEEAKGKAKEEIKASSSRGTCGKCRLPSGFSYRPSLHLPSCAGKDISPWTFLKYCPSLVPLSMPLSLLLLRPHPPMWLRVASTLLSCFLMMPEFLPFSACHTVGPCKGV